MRRWYRRSGDERGAVLVFTSVAMVVVIGTAALAVDVGQKTAMNRRLQAVADVIALDAVKALGGGTAAVAAAAQASALRNSYTGQLDVVVGTKTGASAFTPGGPSVNAVKVTAHGSLDFAFAPGTSNTSRSATAVQRAQAGFSVGSFLASIPPGGNTILSKIFGDAFGVNVLSYDGLANANVTLKAIGLAFPVQALTPSQLLTTSVNLRDFFVASATVLRPGNTAAANVLDAMAASVGPTKTIALGQTMLLETGGETAAATAQLNVLQMLSAAAFLMDGQHTVSIPGTTLNLAGLGSVQVALQVTEPAKTVFGPVGTTADTAQVKLTVTPTIDIDRSGLVDQCGLGNTLSSLLGLNLLGALACLLGPVMKTVNLLDLSASIPIDIEVAGASATLSAINCGSPKGMTITPTLQPTTIKSSVNLQLTSAAVGPVLGASASINASLVSSPGPQTFTESQFGQVGPVGSSAIGLGSTRPLTVNSVSLLGNGVPLGALLNPLVSTLGTVINPILNSLTQTLLDPLNHLLGLNLAGADLTPLAVDCTGVALAE